MAIHTEQRTPPTRPSGRGLSWRVVVAVLAAVALIVASIVAVLLRGSDGGPTAAGPAPSPSAQQPSAQPSPSEQPSGTPSPTSTLARFGYQPLWPFQGVADAATWQQSFRSGAHQPWHLDARQTAFSFSNGYLGYTNIDRVVRSTISGSQAWVTVGYADPNGASAAAAVVHLVKIGRGQDAPWEVVGTLDTTLTLTRPAYGAVVTSPVTAGGHITGVDESLRLQVRTLNRATPLGEVRGIPAGGDRMPWSATVSFRAPAGTVVTLAVSTGGHVAEVERFAVTGVRVAGAG